MVLKKPGSPGTPSTEPTGTGGDKVDLMEHLVSKSLSINPELRGTSRSTGEVMADLRQQAVAKSNAGKPVGSTPGPKLSLGDRRKQTISFFLDQKAEEFEEANGDLAARERALLDEKRALQDRVVDEIADFLALMQGGAESPEAKEVLREHKALLQRLGVTDADITKRVTTRR